VVGKVTGLRVGQFGAEIPERVKYFLSSRQTQAPFHILYIVSQPERFSKKEFTEHKIVFSFSE
jgi:hypothetical protein